jgi:uncharacterized protein HemX
MTLHPNEFPITIQAFDITNNKEFFIAEQVVNNQQEVDTFSSRYAGKVIKAKALSTSESTTTTTTHHTKSKSSAGTVFLILLLIIVILVAVGFYTGWIQRTTGISL